MGADIHGCVEVKRHGWGWDYLMDIKPFISRNYVLFGTYFGCRNYYDVVPLFAFRGFPEYVDFKTKAEYYGEAEAYKEDFDEDRFDVETIDNHSLTYASLKELNNIPEDIDYVNYWLKGKTKRDFGDGLGPLQYANLLTDADYKKLQKGKTIAKVAHGKDYWFKMETIKFATLVDNNPENFKEINDLVRFMNLLMEKFDDVRLVIWFDN